MFGNTRYDRKAAWRIEPPSASQLRLLTELEVPISVDLTKGQASDLISQSIGPDDEQIEFLNFFGVMLSNSATQFDANLSIAQIISDPANKAKWRARSATAEQKEIIGYVDGNVPVGITLTAADKLIRSYLMDGVQNKKHEEIIAILDERRTAEDAKEDRLFSINDLCENLNREPSMYGLKRVGSGLVAQAIEKWEGETSRTLQQLEIDDHFMDELAERIRGLDPTKATEDALKYPQYFRPWEPAEPYSAKHSAGLDGVSWLLGIVGIFLLLVSLKQCSG